MRFALTSLLVIHGLIHLLGFVKAFGLAQVPQLTGRTIVTLGPAWQRPIGGLWLVAAVLVCAAAVLMLLDVAWAWQVGVAALVLSQALIIHAWPDAKAGTAANLILGVAVLAAWADQRFERDSRAAVRELYAGLDTAPRAPITDADVAGLPAPVARWLTRAGAVGRPRPHATHLTQRGGLRTEPGGKWLPAAAVQDFDLDAPGFVWSVDVTMLRVVPVRGRDRYDGGRGHMLIAALALVPMVDARGPAIDQGAALRFLGELVWSPGAALAPYLRWTAVDDTHADATLTWGDRAVTGRFTIDLDGHVTGFAARRYLGGGADAKL